MPWKNLAHEEFPSWPLSLFVLAVLGVFPLVYHNFYVDILAFKYHYYVVCSLLFLVISLAAAALRSIRRGGFNGRSCWSNVACGRMENWIRRLREGSAEMALAVFLLICGISTAASEYFYESFWGNEGRFTGFFLLLIYGLVFFAIHALYRPQRWHLELFLLSSLAVCAIGLLDFAGWDILHFKDWITDQEKAMFTSTIGNINTYTAFVSLSLGASFLLFAMEKNRARCLWYLICTIVFFLAIITGRSDNAYLTLGVLFGLSPLYLFRHWRGIRRYAVLLALFVSSLWLVTQMCLYFPAAPDMDGLFRVLAAFPGLGYAAAGLWGAAAVLYAAKGITGGQGASAPKRIWRIWLALLLLAAVLLLFALYDANAAGNAARYGALGGYLQFDDSWGTNRGYVWRLALSYYRDFPLGRKLFGYGPDTFGILAVSRSRAEMNQLYHVTFDNAHNEYLQFLVTIGLLGLLAYLVFLAACGLRMLKRSSAEPWRMACLFAVACYLGQAAVNLNVPITAPIMWLLLSLGTVE